MTGLILFLLIAGEVVAAVAAANGWLGTGHGGYMPAYRVFHLLQMLAVIGLALLVARQVSTQAPGYAWLSRLVIAGLLLSFLGDLINSFLIDLRFILQQQVLLSILPFSLAHIAYISAFWKLAEDSSSPKPISRYGHSFKKLLLILWLPLAAGLWLIVTHDAGPLLQKLGAAYAVMVVAMALSSWRVMLHWGAAAKSVAVAGSLFVISDCLLGLYLELGIDRPFWASQLIWLTYLFAQCLIARVGLLPIRVK